MITRRTVLAGTLAGLSTALVGGSFAADTAQAVFIPPWPIVKRGATGHPVRTLQWMLRQRGYAVTVDGIFGPQTEAAVKAFQRSRGLTADGIVGPVTWPKLAITIKQGTTFHDEVRALSEERRFRDLKCGCAPITGTFDAAMTAWVKGFQQGTGHLVVDGIVGAHTWQALVAGELAG